MEEKDLIPYEAAEIRAERVLVLAAHPDDEVFGAGGLLARLAEKAEAIRALVLTGGEAQEDRGGGSADPEIRRREARESGAELGISDYVFEVFPDRSLSGRKPDLMKLIRDQVSTFSPDLVVLPSPCEIHPDHRAVAEAVYELVARVRPEDEGAGSYRLLRLAFYEVTQPILPNVLVPLGERAGKKSRAVSKFVSQAAVRDYEGAIAGLNAFRSLTLSGAGPVEAFYVIEARDAAVTPLSELRRAIGPAAIAAGSSQTAPAAAIVRTRNRPALLVEALESLAAQTARPRSVVVVNDGGAPVEPLLGRFEAAFSLVPVTHESSRGRSASANAGLSRVSEDVAAYLDDDDLLAPDHFERLLAARASGPEPIVYSDAVVVLLARDGESWKERHRELQYSMDFDRDFLLFSNYIPLPCVLFDVGLVRKAGAFDEALDFSEDWDLLIRLSREAPFRHVRAVTAYYRVFEGEEGHVEAGGDPFLAARRVILERYRGLRDDETAARVLDRVSRRLWEVSREEFRFAGELAYQRASHRRLAGEVQSLEECLGDIRTESQRRLSEMARIQDEADSFRAEAASEVQELSAEVSRLGDLIRAMERAKLWRLHAAIQKFKGRR
ncbi:MAG: PIG-L family deacetylase [Thermoanaerobaculia bacterium]